MGTPRPYNPRNHVALTSGTRLGPYEILSPLGAGGMGEVYRARDTKLRRDVALKILPEPFASDTDRVARFAREAQTLAALNHPNIAHLHGLEESGGVRALVMELVGGEDLAQRLLRGPIPVDEALPIARQVAEALEAAHEQGIIHRDLKPANIKVRDDGVVKVLDFGLAKALAGDVVGSASGDAAPTDSPTLTSPAMTVRGMILGTAAYMAPEQAKGRPADKRSDIWAFGCLLYEMLTGRRAFEGNNVLETMANVLKVDPAWDRLPSTTPPAVHLLLQRCLRKEKRQRLQDATGVRIELEDALTAPVGNAPAVSKSGAPTGWRSALIAGVASLGAAVIAGLAVWNLNLLRFLLHKRLPAWHHRTGGRTPNLGPPSGCGVSQRVSCWCTSPAIEESSSFICARSTVWRATRSWALRARLRRFFHLTISGSLSSPLRKAEEDPRHRRCYPDCV